MDARNGRIFQIPMASLRALKRTRPLVPLTDEQARTLKQLGAKQRKGHMRNQPCVCGSGRKFKRCCWEEYQ